MSSSIPVSDFPDAFQDQASKLDIDSDGAIGADDIAFAIGQMDHADSTNKLLRRVAKSFATLSILLVCCVFGSTITAARLANGIELDPSNGFAYVKGSHHQEVMKTNEAIVWKKKNIVDATNEQLGSLKAIVLNEGGVRFVVKGHAREASTSDVIVLVEGGTLKYSDAGLVGATGDALALIEANISLDVPYGDGRDGERSLFVGSSMDSFGFAPSF